MNHSTEGVRIHAGFISDLLRIYESTQNGISAPLFQMATDLDLSDPAGWIPMSRYNEMCDWIEQTLGPANIKIAGQRIGERVYDAVVQSGAVGTNPDPIQMLEALKYAADTMIDDPLKRGWEILEKDNERAVMRRTQTFNSVLQHGLLTSLISKTGVRMPAVQLRQSVAEGAEFDEYEIQWVAIKS